VTDPFFGFHHVNAYEADGDVVVDLETVPDAESVGALDLSRLRAGDVDAAAGRLERFRVRDPDGPGTPRVERTTLYDDGTALPTASRDRWLRRHRYVYAQSSDQPVTDWPRALLRFDVETGAVREFDERDYGRAAYFGEPTFVPRPGGDREDDGVLLTEALEPDAGRSTIVVLDAADMTELARAPLPHALPFGFHGRWFPEL
jgi:beta-carotene 15,15'-monooxygenase